MIAARFLAFDRTAWFGGTIGARFLSRLRRAFGVTSPRAVRHRSKRREEQLKRPKIGDVVEFKTTKGFAYALYTHRHSAPPKFGDLIRVFAGFHEHRPGPITAIATDNILFTTFFPLGAAVNRRIFEIVGRIDVPAALKPFPVFRNGTPHPQTKRVGVWWLWDGSKEWRVGALTQEQAYPLLGVLNDTLLIERIEKGWRAENDPVWSAAPVSPGCG
jgi:hypothetical protein